MSDLSCTVIECYGFTQEITLTHRSTAPGGTAASDVSALGNEPCVFNICGWEEGQGLCGCHCVYVN